MLVRPLNEQNKNFVIFFNANVSGTTKASTNYNIGLKPGKLDSTHLGLPLILNNIKHMVGKN